MRRFKDGGISVCFHCHKQLVRVKGGFIFAEIVDPDGRRLRVHKDCKEPALGHGYREAQPMQAHGASGSPASFVTAK